ncbi:GAF domain-containing protein [Micromonospora rifamycinica]|uniref:GAF domain-containing protein n=1 Tax=Micromonospora rifamycinica TaxID=291594 RepID=UPI002E282BB2|nr:GAF domain-containing protein [Micromonospora rifamycinica]
MTEPVASNDTLERRLLNSVVKVAQYTFGAAAASIFLIDPQTDELIFEAVSGKGDGHLVGARFPAHTGIAGWVASSGQSLLVDDLQQSPFDRSAAASTAYVPASIMAAPLFDADECIGVLEVLDPGTTQTRVMADIDLLGLLADQAAIGLELLGRLRAHPADQRSDRAIRLLDVVESMLAMSSRG